MKFETIKSIILTLLVLSSIVLTYSIWTYHPNYELMGRTDVIPEVLISEQKELRQIIRPTTVYHHFDDFHYGTNHPTEIDDILKELTRWDFTKFSEEGYKIPQLKSFIYREGMTEIIFPEFIPMAIYRKILGIKEEDLNFRFDRMVIDLNSTVGEMGTVYFVFGEKEEVYEAKVSSSYLKTFEEKFYKKAPHSSLFDRYSLQYVTDNNPLLVRTDPVRTFAYNYLIETIPGYKFRDALFRNPSFVKGNATASGAEYKDSSSLLSIHFDTNMLLYVNPVQDSNGKMDANLLIQKSIDFVNGHGGWTNQYIYVGIDELERTILYRLYTPLGYPIFNYNGMSEILQIWGQTGIYQYSRNNFSLERLIESTKIELLSGVEIIEKLQNDKNIDPQFIQDIMVGYEMMKYTRDPLIHLEPAWYFKYKDQWIKVQMETEGGTEHGLE